MTNTLKRKKMATNAVLDEVVMAEISQSLLPTTPAMEVVDRIKLKLMSRIKEGAGHQAFVFANQGTWKTICEGVQVKLLHKSTEGKSLLIKMAANSRLPYHEHLNDEESFVVDGEVWLDGILCFAGDYHYATAGGSHHDIHTKTGCTLLVRA